MEGLQKEASGMVKKELGTQEGKEDGGDGEKKVIARTRVSCLIRGRQDTQAKTFVVDIRAEFFSCNSRQMK